MKRRASSQQRVTVDGLIRMPIRFDQSSATAAMMRFRTPVGFCGGIETMRNAD